MATPKKRRSTARRTGLAGTTAPRAKAGRRPIRPLTLGLIAATVLGGGFLVKKAVDKALSSGDDFQLPMLPGSSPSPSRPSGTVASSKYSANVGTFPLRYGQKGELIRTLQNAIMGKGGSAATEIRISGGADGAFGDGMAKALVALGEYSARSVDQVAFNRILGAPAAPQLPASVTPTGSPAAVLMLRPLNLPNVRDDQGRNIQLPEVAALRTQLVAAIQRFDPTATAAAIRAMRNVAGYKAVNYNTMGIRFTRAGIDVRQTVATKVSQTFAGNSSVRAALLAIGLTLDAAGIWHADLR